MTKERIVDCFGIFNSESFSYLAKTLLRRSRMFLACSSNSSESVDLKFRVERLWSVWLDFWVCLVSNLMGYPRYRTTRCVNLQTATFMDIYGEEHLEKPPLIRILFGVVVASVSKKRSNGCLVDLHYYLFLDRINQGCMFLTIYLWLC